MAFIKSCSIDARNDQSATCEVVHETNKAHFRNLLPNRFLPSSVGKALARRSGGPGFNPTSDEEIVKIVISIKIDQPYIRWQHCHRKMSKVERQSRVQMNLIAIFKIYQNDSAIQT